MGVFGSLSSFAAFDATFFPVTGFFAILVLFLLGRYSTISCRSREEAGKGNWHVTKNVRRISSRANLDARREEAMWIKCGRFSAAFPAPTQIDSLPAHPPLLWERAGESSCYSPGNRSSRIAPARSCRLPFGRDTGSPEARTPCERMAASLSSGGPPSSACCQRTGEKLDPSRTATSRVRVSRKRITKLLFLFIKALFRDIATVRRDGEALFGTSRRCALTSRRRVQTPARCVLTSRRCNQTSSRCVLPPPWSR